MGRNPYVAICAAKTAGTGLTLSAHEVASLYTAGAIEAAAYNALNEDGRDMVRRFGWGHLRFYTRNTRATKEKAMRGLPMSKEPADV